MTKLHKKLTELGYQVYSRTLDGGTFYSNKKYLVKVCTNWLSKPWIMESDELLPGFKQPDKRRKKPYRYDITEYREDNV